MQSNMLGGTPSDLPYVLPCCVTGGVEVVSTSASYPPSTNCPLKAKGSNMGILGEEPCFAMRSFVTSHLTILTLARARDSL
jgi:hypothetical protein